MQSKILYFILKVQELRKNFLQRKHMVIECVDVPDLKFRDIPLSRENAPLFEARNLSHSVIAEVSSRKKPASHGVEWMISVLDKSRLMWEKEKLYYPSNKLHLRTTILLKSYLNYLFLHFSAILLLQSCNCLFQASPHVIQKKVFLYNQITSRIGCE